MTEETTLQNDGSSMAPPDAPIGGEQAQYDAAGRLVDTAQVTDTSEELGPQGCPAVSPEDAPFATDKIPAGWNRFPTEEEVAWLNKKFPTE